MNRLIGKCVCVFFSILVMVMTMSTTVNATESMCEHDFFFIGFIWSDDYESCNALFLCNYCDEMYEEPIEVHKSVLEPKKHKEGVISFTVYYEDYCDVKTVAIPATEGRKVLRPAKQKDLERAPLVNLF